MNILSEGRRCVTKLRESLRLSRRLRDWPGLVVLGFARYANFSRRDPVSRIARKVFPILRPRTERMNHLAVLLDPADWSHLMVFDEVVIDNVYDLTLVPFNPDLIIDCGGHIGMFTTRAAGCYPTSRIITFEPMPRNAQVVQAMIRHNRLNAELRQAAVSDRDYSTQFFERMSFGGSMDPAADGVVGAYDVKVVNLIELVRELSPQALLLKMDIEGEEENLLPKLIPHLPPHCAVFFETHTAEIGWNVIADAFRAADFDVRQLRERDPFRDGFALRRGS